MKILMLLDREFPPDIRVENEANSLIQSGHEVHILCYDHQNRAAFEHLKGINIHRFRISKQLAKKSLGLILNIPLFKWIWKNELVRLLNKITFDVIHIHDLPLCILSPFIKKLGLPVVADMHENYPFLVREQYYMNSAVGRTIFLYKQWFSKEKEWLSYADSIICVAPEMKNRLLTVLGNEEKIQIVPNTFSFNSFGAKQIEITNLREKLNSNFIILYVGGFDNGRGLDILLTAIYQLKSKLSDFLLVLVGDGTIINELKTQSESHGISHLVRFEGWKPASNVKSYIEASSICIIPHLKSEQTDNSSPNKLFQYMYFERPVVSSNCTSLEKIIIEEKCGLVFEDRNPEDLAGKILHLYNHPDEAITMGSNGKQAVINKYNWETTVKPLISLYYSLSNKIGK